MQILGDNKADQKDRGHKVHAVHKSLKNYLEKVQPRDSDYLFVSRKGNKAITIQAVNNMIKKWTRAINLAGNYGAHTLT
ncbi:MAG: hypothetical protein U9N83_14145 [Thermodesulfobacteriota bacterium]|nr:hypothetical protein [Thermodesulfobacteriota bacterium]